MANTASRPRRRFGRVRKLPSGRWQAGYTGPDGTVHNAPQTFSTKGLAERWLSITEADIVRGKWSAPERRAETVGAWAERWLARSVHWKATTRAGHEQMLRGRTLPRWGAADLRTVTRRDIEAWVTEMIADGVHPDVIRRAIDPLRAICHLAVEGGALGTDPTARVRLPRPPKRVLTVLTVAQVEALAHEIEHPVFRPAMALRWLHQATGPTWHWPCG